MAEEENYINPSTGISGFINPKQSKKTYGELFKEFTTKKEKPNYAGQYVRIEGNKLVPVKKRTLTPSEYRKVISRVKLMEKPKSIKSFLGLKKRKVPIKDKIKMIRFKNTLEKARIQNQLERLKLQKKVENLRKQGILKQAVIHPIRRPTIYPAYATPEIIGDIDSGFNADINPISNDMWGSEEFLGGERYFDENFYGNEFSNSPFEHLNLIPDKNLSPILW